MIFPALSKVTLLLRNSEKMGHFPQSFLKDAEDLFKVKTELREFA